MKYLLLVSISMILAILALTVALLLRENNPRRGVFTLGDKHIQIAQHDDGSVEWNGSPMTCNEIVIVFHEAEKNCGVMPVPFDKIHFGPFECLSPPTSEDLEEFKRGQYFGDPRCPQPSTVSDYFTGDPAALSRLRDFADQRGLVLEVVTTSDGNEQIPITPSLRSNPAFAVVFQEALNGKLGLIGFGSSYAAPTHTH